MSAFIFLGLRVLAAILLYAFVGWSFYLMWRTLKSQVDFLSSMKIAPIKLGILATNGEKQIVEFQQSDFLIGRDKDCEVFLDDTAVSARHARLSFRHGHWWLEDSGSKNGTILNENRLTMPTILTNGDTIVCGDTGIEIILPE
ncbi:MAG: FHA domain-containing protein [Anaerolineales bacterium]|jgi:pSer/pThr/pTyr-binding forkhead associated (FHA) protein|nr:FHA domain-containing protein [Anaerolineales bacterium]